jgi:ABC-2 type transport system ATP-binding protein
MTPIIETQNLSKWYGQIMAINDMTIKISNGVIGLLGPNGAGKTTLIKLIVGLLKPDRGIIKVLDEKSWNNHSINNRVGYCSDIDNFYENMTGFEFVFRLALLNNFRKSLAEELALKAIETVEMTDNKDRKIGSYSKGMRQRIKLAQSIVHDPELMIFDEPLNGMDPVGRQSTIKLIKQLGDNGKSVIVSSHILHEIEAMTDNILLINNGRILAEGNVHEIRELIDKHPHNVYIDCDKVRFLASILVQYDDIISAKINPEDSGLIVETIKPDELYSRLPKIVVENKININNLYSPDDNLQAVFKYLVG